MGPILVTGAGGFVGQHLLRELDAEVVAPDFDLTDPAAVLEAVREARPDAVVNLAALTSVAHSWGGEAEVWAVNTLGTVNLLEAVRREQPGARVFVVSSGDVYGAAETIPTPESAPLAPLSPYAASKAAAELACERARRADGLQVVVARPFTHIGPGQSETFAVGSWTRQLAQLEAEGGGVLSVGDLSVERDLTDVRDVSRAYRLLLDPAVPARTYNIASGAPVRLEQIVETLVGLVDCPVTVERDPARLRQSDLPVQAGDASLLTETTGWLPEIPLERTLADALDYARSALRQERTAAT